MPDDSSSPISVIAGGEEETSSGLEGRDYKASPKKTLLIDISGKLDDAVLEQLSTVFDVITSTEKLEDRNADYILSEHRSRESLPWELNEHVIPADEAVKVRDEEFLSRAREVVLRNIDNVEFCKKEFALEMCVSQSLLYKKIKSMTGLSLVDYVKSLRMEYALELLSDHTLSISEISERCGFASVSYFGDVFRKRFGKSPSEYRITPPIL